MAFQFIGGSYTSASPRLDAQRSLNLYVETDATGQGRNTAALIGTPGLLAFLTLPFSPIRGMLATDAQRLFVVAGSKYYEVFQDASSTLRGDVGADILNSPVQMWTDVNNHVFIVSNGILWIDGAIAGAPGAYIIPAQYSNGTGTVTTVGTAVTWISGDTFDSSNAIAGNTMVINGTTYSVASVTDSTHLVLTSSAGTQGTTYTGTCDTSGTQVTWDSGTLFDPTWAGAITINGVAYTISDITDTQDLILTDSAGTQSAVTWSIVVGVDYGAFYPVTASCGTFLDGYSIVAVPGGKQFNISSVADGTSWNPIDFAVKEGHADGIVALLADHEELWIYGNQTIEVWSDTGNADFPLQRNASGYIPMGCVAANTPCAFAGTVAWLGGDSPSMPGRLVAYLANGFVPTRVSTPGVEAAWASYAVKNDAVSYTYIDEGHQFWVLSFPSAQATWVYDYDEKVWHERAWRRGTAFGMQRQMFHGYLWDEHVVGDYATGDLYLMSAAYFDDNGTAITRQRAALYPSNSTNWQYFGRFVLDIELNVANPSGTGLVYDYSDDGGQTFIGSNSANSDTTTGSAGRVVWRRGGKTRGRVCRVTYSGGGKVAWINAFADVEQGTT